MKIVLFGKNGQLGWELQRSLSCLGELVLLGSGDSGGDLSKTQALMHNLRSLAPDVIVNAAAYTAVDKAESEFDLCHAINAQAPGVLAEEAARSGAWLVHYSSDYVFDGTGDQPWRELDPTGPLSVYGKTKLEGEQAIRASGCKHLIFRTSWVYAARGANFAKTMLRLAQERASLNVINDQFGAPTGADLLADVTAHALRMALGKPDDGSLSGLYHLAASGQTTWHGYASFVIEHARQVGMALKLASEGLVAVPTSAFPLPAPRPENSRLDTGKLQKVFGLRLPDWQSGVNRMLVEVLKQ